MPLMHFEKGKVLEMDHYLSRTGKSAIQLKMCVCVCVCVCVVTQFCLTVVTSWTVAYQAPLSMEFSRQEYWSG